MRRKTNRILWGIILVAIGVLLGLNALHLLPFNLFFKGWWTLFIIVPSIVGLVTDRNKKGAFIGLLFGVFFLLCEWDILTMSLLWKLALPVAAVLFGLSLLFGKRTKPQEINGEQQPAPVRVSADGSRCVAVFSGQEMHYENQPLTSAEAIAVFGGVDVFAYSAIITKDCVLDVTAIFGGVEIYLPTTVNVVITSRGIFGGTEDHRKLPLMEGIPTVYIRSTAIFGGVDVK